MSLASHASKLTLYVIAGSHPCETARLMLRRKRIAHRESELPPVISRQLLPALGFDGATVPAIAAGTERVQGTSSISRWLDEIRPDPPLFPGEPRLRDAVAEAEAWGLELQDAARRIYLWGLARDPEALGRQAELSSLPTPRRVAVAAAKTVVRRLGSLHGATDGVVAADIEALPAMLDRIDTWIDAGVLAGEDPNAADLQIAPSLAMLMGMEDLRPLIDPRPAAQLPRTFAPSFPSYLSAGILPLPR